MADVMNEHTLSRKFHRALMKRMVAGAPLWFAKIAGGRYQRTGLPDYILCVRGLFVGIELKHPDEPAVPSPKQSVELAAIAKAGGVTACFNDLDRVVVFVDELLAG